MARAPRIKSSIGMQHVMLRGVNREYIFLDDTDRKKFLKCIRITREKTDFILHAYCLMSNHVHLLIQETDEPLSEIMKRFTVSYVAFFNKRYDRVGHLFQDRFRSVPVEREDSYLRAMRYIFQNPVKAGLCVNVSDYRWSNYHSLGTDDGIADSRLVFKIAEEAYIREFMNMSVDDEEMDEIEKTPVTEQDVLKIMKEVSGIDTADRFLQLNESTRANYIQRMIDRGCKVVHITKVLGISNYQMRKMRAGHGKR